VLIDSTGLKVLGAGEGPADKHGRRSRRTYRKLHLGVDTNSGKIIAAYSQTGTRMIRRRSARCLSKSPGKSTDHGLRRLRW
jgi:hypothetical protein